MRPTARELQIRNLRFGKIKMKTFANCIVKENLAILKNEVFRLQNYAKALTNGAFYIIVYISNFECTQKGDFYVEIK